MPFILNECEDEWAVTLEPEEENREDKNPQPWYIQNPINSDRHPILLVHKCFYVF